MVVMGDVGRTKVVMRDVERAEAGQTEAEWRKEASMVVVDRKAVDRADSADRAEKENRRAGMCVRKRHTRARRIACRLSPWGSFCSWVR